MDHGSELIIPILDIGNVSNILQKRGNIGHLSFSNFSYPENIGNLLFPISDMVEMRSAGGRAAPGVRLQGLVFFFGACSWKNDHGDKTCTFFKMASQAKPLCS